MATSPLVGQVVAPGDTVLRLPEGGGAVRLAAPRPPARPNWAERQSTAGALFYFNGCLVAWYSRLQRSVCHSTAEAEYVGASMAAREGIFYRVPPSAFRDVVLSVYERGAASVQGLPQIEKFVMEGLFWSDTPVLQTIVVGLGSEPGGFDESTTELAPGARVDSAVDSHEAA